MKKEEILNRVNPLILKGVAHRGYHNKFYIENGLDAFKNAIEHNFAFELQQDMECP